MKTAISAEPPPLILHHHRQFATVTSTPISVSPAKCRTGVWPNKQYTRQDQAEYHSYIPLPENMDENAARAEKTGKGRLRRFSIMNS